MTKLLYSSKQITFDIEYSVLPTKINLTMKNSNGDVLASPVSPTNISTSGFTIPSFQIDAASEDDIYHSYEYEVSGIVNVPKISQKLTFSGSSILWGDNNTINIYFNDTLLTSQTVSDSGRGTYGPVDINIEIPEGTFISQITFTDEYFSLTDTTLPYTLTGTDKTITYRYGNCCIPDYTLIYKTNGEQVMAKDIKVGDEIFGYDIKTNSACPTEVLFISRPVRDHIVRITLEDDTIAEVTRDHVVYTDKGWAAYCKDEVTEVRDVIDIKEASKLFSRNGEFVGIKNIEYIDYPDGLPCINFRTSVHNYFANNYLIHNAGCPSGENQVMNVYLSDGSAVPRYKVTTPFESFYVKEGDTISDKISSSYRINSVKGITKIISYKLNGTVIDLSTYTVQSDVTLTCGYELTQTETTFVINNGSVSGTKSTGTVAGLSYTCRGFDSSYGSLVSGTIFGSTVGSCYMEYSPGGTNSFKTWDPWYKITLSSGPGTFTKVTYDVYANNVKIISETSSSLSLFYDETTSAAYSQFSGSTTTIRIVASLSS